MMAAVSSCRSCSEKRQKHDQTLLLPTFLLVIKPAKKPDHGQDMGLTLVQSSSVNKSAAANTQEESTFVKRTRNTEFHKSKFS